jgi:hypothetical protein
VIVILFDDRRVVGRLMRLDYCAIAIPITITIVALADGNACSDRSNPDTNVVR